MSLSLFLAGGFPPRGGRGGRGSARGNRGAPSNRGGGKDQTPLKFESDFDFESENAKFNREQIEKEFKEKLSISEYNNFNSGYSLYIHMYKYSMVMVSFLLLMLHLVNMLTIIIKR